MGRVLICEPHAEVRELLAYVVARLGHAPVFADDNGAEDLGPVDAVVVEPAHAPSLATARAVAGDGGIPLVCASVFPANGHAVGLHPFAYLLKPFSLPDLEDALSRALAARPGAA